MTNEETIKKLQEVESRIEKLELYHKEPEGIWHVLWIAFLLSVLVFTIILVIGSVWDRWKNQKKHDKK